MRAQDEPGVRGRAGSWRAPRIGQGEALGRSRAASLVELPEKSLEALGEAIGVLLSKPAREGIRESRGYFARVFSSRPRLRRSSLL